MVSPNGNHNNLWRGRHREQLIAILQEKKYITLGHGGYALLRQHGMSRGQAQLAIDDLLEAGLVCMFMWRGDWTIRLADRRLA